MTKNRIEPNDMNDEMKWTILRMEIEIEHNNTPKESLTWVLGKMDDLEKFEASKRGTPVKKEV